MLVRRGRHNGCPLLCAASSGTRSSAALGWLGIDTGAALKALKCAIGNGHEIVPWNDAPERTHAEVMAAFDRAIAAEQAKEPQ